MKSIGLNTSEVRTSAEGPAFKLGERCSSVANEREYIYVEADEAITSGNAVLIHEDYGAEQIDSTSSAPGAGQGMPAGLAVATIASGGFGWVQVKGPGDVNLNTGTSCAVHTQLTSSATAGQLDDATTAGLEVIDGFVTTGAEASNLATCMLNYPTVGRTL